MDMRQSRLMKWDSRGMRKKPRGKKDIPWGMEENPQGMKDFPLDSCQNPQDAEFMPGALHSVPAAEIQERQQQNWDIKHIILFF